MTDTVITQQLLPKAPRLLPDGSGYDWREFDRWLQRVQNILGAPQNSASFNIASLLEMNNDVNTLLNLEKNDQQEIRDLAVEIDSLSVISSMDNKNEQKLNDLFQLASDNQILYWMEA